MNPEGCIGKDHRETDHPPRRSKLRIDRLHDHGLMSAGTNHSARSAGPLSRTGGCPRPGCRADGPNTTAGICRHLGAVHSNHVPGGWLDEESVPLRIATSQPPGDSVRLADVLDHPEHRLSVRHSPRSSLLPCLTAMDHPSPRTSPDRQVEDLVDIYGNSVWF